LHSIEAQPIHQALWQARLPNFTPKNRDISFMIFSIFIPYSFILERLHGQPRWVVKDSNGNKDKEKGVILLQGNYYKA
jgi:hypothetical protein